MRPSIALRPLDEPSVPLSKVMLAGDIAERLRSTPPFLGCRSEDLARMLPHVAEAHFEAGEVLFEAGKPADHLYVVLGGRVELSAGHPARKATPAGACVGLEAGADRDTYVFSARAEEHVTALHLPRKCLTALIRAQPSLGKGFSRDLVTLLSGEPPAAVAPAAEKQHHVSWSNVLGWALTLLAPAVVLALGPRFGFGKNATLFLALFSAAVFMWVFTLVDEYVPALFAVLSILMMDLAPAKTVLSGFISDGFFEAMSILGLGVVIVASGLSFRLLLRLLLWLPNRPAWHNFGLLLLGTLFVGSSRVDLQACKLEYSIVSPK